MENITKITLAWELYQSKVKIFKIAESLKIHRETVGIWISEATRLGLIGFLDKYLKAKKGERIKRQVDPILKRWVWDIRDREKDCCGQKILYFLEKEHAVKLSVPKIYEILSEKYILKSKWKKNQLRGAIPVADHKRQVVQMDTVDFGEIFAFTAVDIYSREVDVLLRPSLTAQDGQIFLHTSMKRRFNNFVETIQTDGGPEFKAEFHEDTRIFANRHRFARPYRKNEQSYIESFNRSFRKECLGWIKYKQSQIDDLTKEVENYLWSYHYHRPHCSLGMRPPLEEI